jgi:7-dehydrocholesterol reductase
MVESKNSETVHSAVVTYFSMISLLTLCPPFVILLWYTMTAADGSVLNTFDHLFTNNNNETSLLNLWPTPTLLAFKIIAVYAAFQAALQLLLPGHTVYGPISPAGNRPVYKANGVAAYLLTLLTYLALWWFGIFNPTIVYDHLGEIYSTLIFGSFVFCIFLYIKGHLAPSSTDSGSSGNLIIDF